MSPLHANLTRAALVLLGSYGALAAAGYALQRRLLYPAPTPALALPPDAGDLLRLTAPSGRAVFALWMPAASPDAPAVVHFHGNGDQLSSVAPLGAELRRRGLHVLAVEYPGYSFAAAQDPSEDALYEAAETALVHLRDQLHIPAARTTLQGQSLGSGVAVEMARRGHGARLALLSPYTSIPDVAARIAPFLPARALVRDRYATAEKAPRIRLPTLLVHGDQDELIPVTMTRTLAGLFPDNRMEVLAGLHHNDLFVGDHGRALLDRLARFASLSL